MCSKKRLTMPSIRAGRFTPAGRYGCDDTGGHSLAVCPNVGAARVATQGATIAKAKLKKNGKDPEAEAEATLDPYRRG